MSAGTLAQHLTSIRLPLEAFLSRGQTRRCRRDSSLSILPLYVPRLGVGVGAAGLQQGDPLSMQIYSAATHPIWARIMARSPTTHGVGIADDAFLEDEFPRVLHTLADAIKSFRTDAGLEMQPTKLKIHIKGVSLQRARELIKACIDNDDSLESLRVLLDSVSCIQVDGLRPVLRRLGAFMPTTTFMREITPLLQIRQFAHLRSASCSLQGSSSAERSARAAPSAGRGHYLNCFSLLGS
jgi:hypothetical protein